MLAQSRALHFVLKIGILSRNLEFFRDKLGMTVLRHEEFQEGCDAACNGPYDGKWSKTMIGYGPEDTHFVLELTYNYTVNKYELGNDLQYIKLALNETNYNKIRGDSKDELVTLSSPDGYKFIVSKSLPGKKQDVTEVCLSSNNLEKSRKYWCDLLKMNQIKIDAGIDLLLNYDTSGEQANLRFKFVQEKIDHKAAYGRIAFSCPAEDLKPVQKVVEDAKCKVLTPYISLGTPGKASVQVVILADPDGHEICFVGDEGFRQLSQVDPIANSLIEKSIAEDKSDDWYAKKNRSKQQQ